MSNKEYLNNKIKYTLNEKKIIYAIEEARKELIQCREYFDIVDEPRLIDYAIYREAAAKAKYTFLLAEAKKLNIKVNAFYTIEDEKAN